MTPLETMLETMLRRDESERLAVYDDATGQPVRAGDHLLGHPTIGVGRALDVRGITKEESAYLLAADIEVVQAEAEGHFPWYGGLGDQRKAVVLSMLFQLGYGKFSGFMKFIGALQYQSWARAAAEIRNSAAYQQAPQRWERFAKQMETGVFQP